jgi:hypothetical protein
MQRHWEEGGYVETCMDDTSPKDHQGRWNRCGQGSPDRGVMGRQSPALGEDTLSNRDNKNLEPAKAALW